MTLFWNVCILYVWATDYFSLEQRVQKISEINIRTRPHQISRTYLLSLPMDYYMNQLTNAILDIGSSPKDILRNQESQTP